MHSLSSWKISLNSIYYFKLYFRFPLVKVSVSQSCLTLCSPMDCSPPDSSLHGILRARTLEWVPIPFSRDLPNPGAELRSPTLQADSFPSEPPGKPKFPLAKSLFCFFLSFCAAGRCGQKEMCLVLRTSPQKRRASY